MHAMKKRVGSTNDRQKNQRYQLTSIASASMKNAINNRKRALTKPAITSALTYLQ